jgi:hypothetical protein
MVDLGIPSAPPAPLHPRRKTKQLKVGSVGVGSESPVSVQSMCTTLTADVNATLQQIAELTAAGCQIVRVAVPSQDDADALAQIAKKSQIPVIADIHFQPKYIFAAIDAGCAAVRVNPGNIKQFDDKVKEVAKAAGDAGIPIRIGVNAGSLDPRLLDSRSAASIIGGMQQGLSRHAAAEFSFFLAVPTMLAVTCYSVFLKTYEASQMKGYELILKSDEHIQLFLLGNVVAFIVAILAIKFFIEIIKQYGFKPWGWYRIIVGTFLLLYFSFLK